MKLQVTLLIVPYFLLVLLLKNCAYSGISQGVKQEAHQMVKGMLNAVNKTLSHDDAGKLLLRLAVGGLMLFHGLHKLLDGVGGISGMLVAKGLPGFIAYGVLVGEVVAPCLLILGVLTRPAALVLAFTMVVAWLMVGLGKTFALDAVGAWAIENLVYFFVGAGDCATRRRALFAGRPVGLAVKMPHLSWGVKSILLPVCNFFSLRKCLSHVA